MWEIFPPLSFLSRWRDLDIFIGLAKSVINAVFKLKIKSSLNWILLVIKTPTVDFKHCSPHLNELKGPHDTFSTVELRVLLIIKS